MKTRMRTEYRMTHNGEVIHTFEPVDVAYARSVCDVEVSSQPVMHGTFRPSRSLAVVAR